MSQSNSCRRRGRQDIIMEVLKAANNGVLKTQIIQKAGMSYIQLERYLNALKEADLITQKSGVWKTTRKGLNVIDACRICHSLLEKVG